MPSAPTQSTYGKCTVYCELERCYFPLYNGEPFYSSTPWVADVREGGGGLAVNRLPKKISQVAQIFTKESKINEGHIATT